MRLSSNAHHHVLPGAAIKMDEVAVRSQPAKSHIGMTLMELLLRRVGILSVLLRCVLLTQFSIWILYQVGNSTTPYTTLSHSQLLLMIDQDPFSSFFNLRRAKGDNSKITQYREGQNLGNVHHAGDYFILFTCWRPIASSWNNRFLSQDISKHLDRLQSLSENSVKTCK